MAKRLIDKLKNTFKMTEDEISEKELTEEKEGSETEEAESKKKKSKKSRKKGSKVAEELEEAQIALAESKDKHLRLFAEFENYKKRNMRERLDLMSTAASSTLKKLLPVLDDFDRYKKNAEDDGTTEQLSEGVLMVYNKLYTTLAGMGLTPMETNGEVFDSEIHEAITEIPAPTEDMKGKIIDTVESGYKLNDKIIRFAKVVVGK